MRVRRWIENGDGACYYKDQRRSHSFVLPETVYLERDTLHRERKGIIRNSFLRFRCNDPDCNATCDVLLADVTKACEL